MMNIKVLLLGVFSGFCFLQNIVAGEQKKSELTAVQFCAMPISDVIDPLESVNVVTRSIKVLQGFIGAPAVSTGRLESLERKGYPPIQYLVFVAAYKFSDGQVRYSGVLPEGARFCKLPSSPEDTLGYRCPRTGTMVFVPLSREQSSLVHPKF